MTEKRRAYAEGTTVAVEKTRIEIEQTLDRYGATGFAYGAEGGGADGGRRRVEFVAHGRRVRFDLTIPALKDKRFVGARDPWSGPNDSLRRDRWESEQRRLWRALLLGIKAKLEAVESGMAIFEEEFMANIVMPDGRTVGQHAMPAIARAYETGRVVALLPETTN